MLYATNRFPGDGTTTQYEISFVGGYLDRAHVKAYVEGADLVQTPVTLSSGNFLGQYTIGGLTPVPVGSTLVIYRDTPKAPIVDFVNGSRFTEANLDTATRQGSFIAAEGADAVSPTGLAGVIQQVEGFSAAAGVARDQAVSAQNTAGAYSAAASLSESNAYGSAMSAAADAIGALNNRNMSDTAAFNASASATQAQGFRDTASTHAASAAMSATGAAASYDSFDARYLGAKAVAPTTDNAGGVLLTGALYWDTALPGMRSWNGSVWVTLPAATAASLANTPAGSISATTVQAAINELDSEKVAKTDVIAIAKGGTGATSANAAADAIGAFSRGTLLGTVSQSAGVPTGAVIERGSNANGQYVRFADGTQICGSATAITGASGVEERTTTFPAAFVSGAGYDAFMRFELGSGADARNWAATTKYGSLTAYGCTFMVYSGGVVGTRVLSVGRWF